MFCLFLLFTKLLRRIQLFSLHHQTESLQACTPTLPNESPSSQMHWEGDPLSPKHNHSNPGWGCLEVNIHGTLIRNIWPPKRVDTAQAGSGGFVVGTQSYRAGLKTQSENRPGQGSLGALHRGTGKFRA